MIKRTLSNELSGSLGQQVALQGWVRRVREVGSSLVFLILADRSGEAQVVLNKSLTSQLPTLESVVEITGVVQASRSRVFPYELAANQLIVLSESEPLPFPINQAELGVGLDLMDQFRPLALRHPIYQDVFRVQHRILDHFAEFFSEQGFMRVATPKMVATGTEGGAELDRKSVV